MFSILAGCSETFRIITAFAVSIVVNRRLALCVHL